MRVLSLFSGGGLGDYGLEKAGFEIVGQVEIDEYCQKILALRWPDVPKWRDIREVKGAEVRKKIGRIDIVSGGFPCTDISIANADPKGLAGEKSGLWREQRRIIGEIRPRFCIVENVSALLVRGLGTVLGDLAALGYDTEYQTLSSRYFGALHRRRRVWIVGYAQGVGRKHSFDATSEGVPKARFFKKISVERAVACDQREFYKEVRAAEFVRKSNETPNRMDRIRICGNGQDPYVVKWIGERIMEFDKGRT